MKKHLFLLALILITSQNVIAQWQPVTMTGVGAESPAFISTPNANTVFALCAASGAAGQTVAKSTDFGATWNVYTIPGISTYAPSSIFALDDNNVWATFYDISDGVGGIVMHSSDGGVTWLQTCLSCFVGATSFANFTYFWDINNGVTMGDPETGYFEIWTTNDGGGTWQRTSSPSIPAPLGTEYGLTDVYGVNGTSTLWLGTTVGRILKTTDKGLTWTVASTPYPSQYIGGVSFQDATTGLIVPGSTATTTDCAASSDGGLTWAVSGMTSTLTQKLGLCYVPGTTNTYFTGGGSGSAFTNDGGVNWILSDNLYHTNIKFADATHGWANSITNGTIYKWDGPVVPNCVSFLTPLSHTLPTYSSVCSGEFIGFDVKVDISNDASLNIDAYYTITNALGTVIGAGSVANIMINFFNASFTPDPGTPNIGTLHFETSVTNSSLPDEDVTHLNLYLKPTQCGNDSSSSINTNIKVLAHNETCVSFTQATGTCTLVVDTSGCNLSPHVNYTYQFQIGGTGPFISGTQFTMSSNGTFPFAWIISNGECQDTMYTSLTCTGIGIDENYDKNNIILATDFNANQYTLISNNDLIQWIKIMDIQGKEIFYNRVNATNYSFNILDLTSGKYYIQVMSNKGLSYLPIIKN